MSREHGPGFQHRKGDNAITKGADDYQKGYRDAQSSGGGGGGGKSGGCAVVVLSMLAGVAEAVHVLIRIVT